MRSRFFVLVVVGLSILASSARAAAGPMATLKQKNSEVDRLLRSKADPGSPAEKKQREDIRQLAGTLLDYGELARRALDSHWEKLRPAQQKEFVTTFRQLVERSYVRQLQTNLNYEVQYKDEQIADKEATVSTTIKVKTEGKTTDADITYKLKQAGERWVVYDVITDEVSLLRNYRSQFNKIITEKSYDDLIKKMKAKLAEAM